MKKIILVFLFVWLIWGMWKDAVAQAAPNFAITPAIMDLSGIPRDNLNRTLTIQNNENRQIQLFAFTQTLDDGATEDANSAGGWLEITRGAIIIGPNEKKEIPFINRIHIHAKPGIYHAQITFAESSFTRAEAETNVTRGEGRSIIINTTVEDRSIEQAGLLQFVPARAIFFSLPLQFTVRTQNSGNIQTTPYGDIRLINRRQEEKASAQINPNNESLAKGESRVFSVDISDVGMGKYKAVLSLSYGNGSSRLQDVVTIWYIPLSFAFIFSTLLLALLITAGYLITHKPPHHPSFTNSENSLHTGFILDEPPHPNA